MNSSTAVLIAPGLSMRYAFWSGWRESISMAEAVTLREVSLPPTRSSRDSEMISFSSNRFPPTSACTRMLTRSSRGWSRRSSIIFFTYSA